MEPHLRTPSLPRVCLALLFLCGFLHAQRVVSTPVRQAADDLEVTGLSRLPRYVTRAALLKLPQVSTVIEDDPDFAGLRLRVSGVPLETLAWALGVPASDDLIDLLCTDKYRAHYPADYVVRHRPILVLQVDGKHPAIWAAVTKHEDPGPYFVAHAHFVPAFKVLSHEDQRQVPTNVVLLHVTTTKATYGPISPPGLATREVDAGFTIAKQNCLRCHAEGAVGGTKSPFTWRMLGAMAKDHPQEFQRYIRNPLKVNPHATMPGNATYDDGTLAALTAYFQAMADTGRPQP